MTRRRLDLELVRRGLVPSRELARAVIASGEVTVGGAPAEKAARLVSPADPIEVRSAARFVGRGGEKLAAALDRFSLAVSGLDCLDVGASTGGFTDCLLEYGARGVCALDVGHGQLHPRIRAHDAVHVVERTNIRALGPAEIAALGGPWPLVVVDVSFISLTTVAASLVECVQRPGRIVALVKPQFEVGRAAASAGRGVVRDPELWRESLVRVTSAWLRAGAVVLDAMVSPLRGGSGNVEFLQVLAVESPGASEFVPGEPATDPEGPGDTGSWLSRVLEEAQSQ